MEVNNKSKLRKQNPILNELQWSLMVTAPYIKCCSEIKPFTHSRLLPPVSKGMDYKNAPTVSC